MKVCILSKTADPQTGGLGRHVYELSNALVDQGVEFTILTKKGFSHKGLKAEVEEVPYINLYQDVLNSYSAGYRFYKKLKEVAGRFDIIHGHGLVSASYSIGKKLGVPDKPFVYTLHGVSSEHTSRKYLKPLAKLLHSPEKSNIKQANGLIAVSEDAKKRAIEHYGVSKDKIRVIYNGVDTQKFQSTSKFDNNLLFVGHMNSRKGPDILLDSFIELKEDYEDLTLSFVGSGRLKKELEQKVSQNNLEDSVKFYENIEEKELIDLYSKSIFVLPSAYEGFGMVYIEAMACKSPVIGCKLSAVPEVIEDCEDGLLVDRNVESVKEGIKKVLEDQKLRKRLSEKGREKAELFDWKNIAKRTVEYYKEIIDQYDQES